MGLHCFGSPAIMSCEKAIVQCGAWSAMSTQSQSRIPDTVTSLYPMDIADGSPDRFTAPPASSGDEQTNFDSVADPTPPGDKQTNVDSVAHPMPTALTTAVSEDTLSISSPASKETQPSQAGPGLLTSHELVTFNEISKMPQLMQAKLDTSNHESLTFLTSPGRPLTSANLTAHQNAISALVTGDNSVATWLATSLGERPLNDVDWSHLVASDPLAAEIEAAAGVATHH